MREETRKEAVVFKDVNVYTADDGTEFKNRWDCIRYEQEKLLKPLLDNLQRCKELDYYPNFDGQEYADHHDYKWYFVRNKDDVDTLNRVYENLINESYIGTWINVEENDDCDAWFSTIDDGIKYATTVLTKLGYKVEITKEVK